MRTLFLSHQQNWLISLSSSHHTYKNFRIYTYKNIHQHIYGCADVGIGILLNPDINVGTFGSFARTVLNGSHFDSVAIAVRWDGHLFTIVASGSKNTTYRLASQLVIDYLSLCGQRLLLL